MKVWQPAVGDWVVYSNGYDPPEDGEVTEVLSETTVRVRYTGDRVAKMTYVRDLRAPMVGDE